MFAHQVIERVRAHEEIKSDHLMALRTLIEKSQKFHFDDLYFDSKTTIERFTKSMRLPFPVTWIDYNDAGRSHTKGAFLCKEKNGVIDCYAYHWATDPLMPEYMWHLYPYSLQIFTDAHIQISNLISQVDPPDGSLRGFAELFGFLLLLCCKNLATEKVKAPEKLNKKRRKNGKQGLYDYHILRLVLPSERKGCSAKSIPLFHNRIHLCRGHFKEYTAEHPLFGHYTGLYWWQPHVRGQNKTGVVMKDYAVISRC